MTTLQEAFEVQAVACDALGSPFMARLLRLLVTDWPTDTGLAHKCATFTGDIGPSGHSLPLRIAGGLHALRLSGDGELTAVYPPNAVDEASFATAILNAFHQHDDFLCDWINSAPQTNEIRRSAALMPGAALAAARFGLPICLSELGASGGLNLMWDHFAIETPNWTFGAANPAVTLTPEWHGIEPTSPLPQIAARRGVDLNPLDPTNPDDLHRMTAYLWPDQPFRLDMTRAAAGAVPAPVDKGDAVDWLETRLNAAPEGHLHLIQNTVAWQYFPDTVQARGIDMIHAAGKRATAEHPLAWLQLEADGDPDNQGGAGLTLQIWPTGETINLGRADFHGRWVKWDPKEV